MLPGCQTSMLRRPALRAWRAAGASRPRTIASASASLQAAQQQPAAAPAPDTAALNSEPTAAYVHLPFCKRKCRYCDFPVIAVGMNPPTDHVEDNMRAYVDLLCQEIASTRRLNSSGPLKTVFFGGGTPSLISLPLLEQILSALDKAFGIQTGAEISIEADPGTFDAARLRSYMGLGVNRVSVGAQAFQDELLELCGRGHDLRDVYRGIEAIYAAGVPNWSLDLMSGLPNLTPERWQASLEAAIDADPHHLSVYDLQVEEHTPFAKLYRPGMAPLPADDVAAGMYCTASTLLRGAGYEHYEVSNYSKLGYRCAHNMVYWEGKPFYGFGMGSASYLEGRRFSRPKRLNAYRTWVGDFASTAALAGALSGVGSGSSRRQEQAGVAEEPGGAGAAPGEGPGAVPGLEQPRETAQDELLDTVMLRLRLADGLDLRALSGKSLDGEPLSTVVLRALKPHIEKGTVLLLPADSVEAQGGTLGAAGSREGGSGGGSSSSSSSSNVGGGGSGGEVVRVRLSDPEGFVVSNDVISDVFVALEEALGLVDLDE